jgi:hypothetical protein
VRTPQSDAINELEALDRWLDEVVDGLKDLPPLPADFSRADLHDDHD